MPPLVAVAILWLDDLTVYYGDGRFLWHFHTNRDGSLRTTRIRRER